MRHQSFQARAEVVRAVRRFFDACGFLEVHTPRLVGLPGQEPYLDPFWTEVTPHGSRDTHHRPQNAALVTSPEYAMKKLLGEGLDKIYDLGPCFRDGEPWDLTHDVEFLLLEWYRREAGMEVLMDDAEAMVRFVADAMSSVILHPSPAPFRRLTVAEALWQYAGVHIEPLLDDRDALAELIRSHGYTATDGDAWDDLFFKIFLTEVEPKLGWNDKKNAWQPTFLFQYPSCMAALARRDPADPRFAMRVELYIGDMELANGFAELSDPKEQRERFEADQILRAKLGKKVWPVDERLLDALPRMGDAAGMAFGVDRLVMLLTGASSIEEIMPIPIQERFGQVPCGKGPYV